MISLPDTPSFQAPLRRLRPCLALLLGLILLSACHNDDTEDTPGDGFRRTVIIYMAAQNSLGYEQGAACDSAEIAQGARYLKEDDNLILFIDDARAPRIHRVTQKYGRARVERVYQYPADLNSADPSTLQDVLDRVARLYPSRSYGLVLWSHGTGWLLNASDDAVAYAPALSRGFGIDVGPGGDMQNDRTATGEVPDNMDIPQLAQAIKESGLHFDYLVFDACLMQNVEVAYDLRHVADYIVASPATTPFYGLYYTDQLRKGLFTVPTNDETIRQIVDTHYYDVTENAHTKDDYANSGMVLSVVRTAGLDSLAAATARVMPLVLAHRTARNLSAVTTGYIDFNSYGYPDMFDMKLVMAQLLPESAYREWLHAFERCVIYQRATEQYYYGKNRGAPVMKPTLEGFGGLSMYFPQNKYAISGYLGFYNAMYRQLSWYTDVWPVNGETPDEYPTYY